MHTPTAAIPTSPAASESSSLEPITKSISLNQALAGLTHAQSEVDQEMWRQIVEAVLVRDRFVQEHEIARLRRENELLASENSELRTRLGALRDTPYQRN